MQVSSKLIFAVAALLLLSAVPGMEANSGGKHNQASSGCGCHSNGGGVTVTHNFPAEYTAGQTYSVTIDLTGAGGSTTGGFNVVVDQGQLSNPGTGTKINGGQNSATHSNGNQIGWNFDWTAPATGSGDVTASIAVMKSNGNNWNSGDSWDNTQFIIPEFILPNDPPSVSNVDLIPIDFANTSEDLILIYQFSDPNGDPESGTMIHWYVDGVRQSSFDNMDMISSANTAPGEMWKAEVTPSDGIDFGQAVMSNVIEITDIDTDNDGYDDQDDAFPDDPNEHADSDNDGTLDQDEIDKGFDPLKNRDPDYKKEGITNLINNDVNQNFLIKGFSYNENVIIEAQKINIIDEEEAVNFQVCETKTDKNGKFTCEINGELQEGSYYLYKKDVEYENNRIARVNVKSDSNKNFTAELAEEYDLITTTKENYSKEFFQKFLGETLYNKYFKEIIESKSRYNKEQTTILKGQAEVGNIIIVTWRSLILSSTVIADASQGEYQVYIPKELEGGEHNILVYAYNPQTEFISNFIKLVFSN